MRPYDTGFQATFGSETTLTQNITGYYESGKIYNYYMNFEVEGTQYMLLILEYGANDDILAYQIGSVFFSIIIALPSCIKESDFAIREPSQPRAAAASSTVALDTSNSFILDSIP